MGLEGSCGGCTAKTCRSEIQGWILRALLWGFTLNRERVNTGSRDSTYSARRGISTQQGEE